MFQKLTQEHYRANPTDLELDEEEEGVEEPGPGEQREDPQADRRGPDRDAAARRVEQRRQRDEQIRQEGERIRRETRDGVMKELEPRLKMFERLQKAFGPETSTTADDDIPEPPDPYDPNYKQLHREYLRKFGDGVAARAVAQARQANAYENQQKAWQEREAARTSGNDRLVAEFFGDDERATWPEQKRMELLTFVRNEFVPRGPHGEYTQAQLERAERELFREEVEARIRTDEQGKFMRHLGAPPRASRNGKPGKNLTPQQVEMRAEALYGDFERMSRGHQVNELERMQRDEPAVYKFFVGTLLKAADEFDADNI